MLSTLVDESTIVYIVLILLCSGLLFAWRRTRKWWYLVATGFGFVLVIVFAIMTHLVVTDRQKIENVIRESAAAVERKDAQTIQRLLAHNFRYHSAQDVKTFMDKAREAMNNGNAREVKVWDLKVDPIDKKQGTGHISLLAKPRGNWSEAAHFIVEADLVRENDGQWRIRTFDVFHPYIETKRPITIPGF